MGAKRKIDQHMVILANMGLTLTEIMRSDFIEGRLERRLGFAQK